MKVLVCGDRAWNNEMAIYNRLAALKAEYPGLSIIEGGAGGADTLAWQAANFLQLPVEILMADWKNHGRKAGPIRNRQMLDQKPDLVLAFHANLDRSRGTKDCVTEARRRGIPVEVIER